MLGHCQTDHAFENDSTTWASWMWQKELTLSGNLDKSLKVSGEISSNGYKLEEFVPQKTSAYVSQNCLHIPEMTVKETLDYSSRFQGVGSRAEILIELSRREKDAGIVPHPDIDTYMKAVSIEGQKTNLQTDNILKDK